MAAEGVGARRVLDARSGTVSEVAAACAAFCPTNRVWYAQNGYKEPEITCQMTPKRAMGRPAGAFAQRHDGTRSA